MLDPQHNDLPGVLVDPIQDPVSTAAGGEYSGQLSAEFFSDAVWRFHEGAGEELDDRRSHMLGRVALNCPCRWWGDDQLVHLHGELRAKGANGIDPADHVSAPPRDVGLANVRER